MTNEHLQFMVTHKIDASKILQITSNVYYNDFSRNWYKLNDVVVDGDKVKISKLLEAPQDYPSYMDIINGTSDSDANAFILKANNRSYLSKGVQTKLDFHWNSSDVFHDLEIGLRYHYDDEDRFQWKDGYSITDGQMNLTSEGAPGSDANRISKASDIGIEICSKIF